MPEHMPERLARLEAQTLAVLRKHGDQLLLLELRLDQVLSLCGTLQLALRHPRFAHQPTAAEVRKIIMRIRDALPAEYGPIKETIDLGFHSRFDQPPSS